VTAFSNEDFFGGKKRGGVDLEEDNLEDEDDDEDDEDPEETMARYYKRKEALQAEKAASAAAASKAAVANGSSFVASSPQDSSWVVDDFAAEFNEATNGESATFGSPSAFDGEFFNPLATAGAASASPGKQAGDSDFEDFDPFGTGIIADKKPVSASMPIVKKQTPPQPVVDDFGGVTPPGFEVIDKM
jgi:hypothetical protein